MKIAFLKVAKHQTFTFNNVKYRKMSETFATYPHHHQTMGNTLQSDLIIFQPNEKVDVVPQ